MLINLIAWIYISFICLAWGNMLLALSVRLLGLRPEHTNSHSDSSSPSAPGFLSAPELPFICLAGLSLIGTLALYLSLKIPLQEGTHSLILILALVWCVFKKNRQNLRLQIKEVFTGLSITSRLLLTCSILMTLVISSHWIIHADTLFYHARSILLFEKYKAVPGIANIRPELGLQSLWFASLAIFKCYSGPFGNAIFLNGAVLCWYFVFIIRRIDKGDAHKAWLWLAILAYTFINWTSVRLTAASASPDFIVFLYTGAAFYTFMRSSQSVSSPTPSANSRALYSWLSLLYCCTALLIKLSAIALLVLALFIMADAIKRRRKRLCLLGLFTGVFLLLSLLGRNYICSGYPLYPSAIPDIFIADWKMPASAVREFSHYISIYARLPTNLEKSLTQSYTPFSHWIPEWWRHIGWTNQWLIGIILASGILVPVFVFFSGKKHPVLQKGKYAVVFCAAFAGSLLWFMTAPDPRFGVTFLIPLFYILVNPWMGITLKEGKDRLISRLYLGMTGIFLAAMIGFSIYRLVYFFNSPELICPAGIVKDAFEPLECGKLSIDLMRNKLSPMAPNSPSPSPTAPDNANAPFTPNSTDSLPPESRYRICPYVPRGKTIAEGFKP